jgi:hypothetical protein
MLKRTLIIFFFLFAYTFVLVHNSIPHEHKHVVKVSHHHDHDNHDHKHDHSNSEDDQNSKKKNGLTHHFEKIHLLVKHSDSNFGNHTNELAKKHAVSSFVLNSDQSFKIILYLLDKSPPGLRDKSFTKNLSLSSLSLRAPPFSV